MSFGEGNLHERVDELERHNAILQADAGLYRGRWMERGAAIAEQRERIEQLERERDEYWSLFEMQANETACQSADLVAEQKRGDELESLLRDIMDGDPRCTARSCGDCEHEEDDGCGIRRRMAELGIGVAYER